MVFHVLYGRSFLEIFNLINFFMIMIMQVTDVQASQLVEAHFRAQLRTTHVTKEGEVLYNYMR